MANQHIQKAFDPTKSATASKMMNMTEKEVFERYFVKNNNVFWVDDFNQEKYSKNRNEEDLYPKTLTLLGQPLNVICTIINKFTCQYLPAEYKLNSKSLLEDMEAILVENPRDARNTAATGEANEFTVQFGRFFTQILNKGLDYTDTLIISNQ